jgi:hypothetical protein
LDDTHDRQIAGGCLSGFAGPHAARDARNNADDQQQKKQRKTYNHRAPRARFTDSGFFSLIFESLN